MVLSHSERAVRRVRAAAFEFNVNTPVAAAALIAL